MMEKRPNILHLFCDQLRFDAIHAHNNPVIKTPNIDRLVEMVHDYRLLSDQNRLCQQ